jgi:dTMP kinase
MSRADRRPARVGRARVAGPARGRRQVVVGVVGAGTTTQARLLAEALRARGRMAHVTAEPSGGPVGALVRQVLTRRVAGGDGQGFDPTALALLFAADRLDHLSTEVTPKLAAGVDVVCDRFTLSSLAYQGVTTGKLRWVELVNGRAVAPAVTLFLRVRPAVSLARRQAASPDPELFEIDAFQRKVARAYDRGIAALREAGQRVVELDGEASVPDVAAAVQAEVERIRR